MKRRNFLSGLMLAPTAGAMAASPVRSLEDFPSHDAIRSIMRDSLRLESVRVGSWSLMWTGWKRSWSTLDVVGQWAAFPMKDPSLKMSTENLDESRRCMYVSTPGGFGFYQRGDELNTGLRYPQISTLFAASSELERERRNALRLILDMVKHVRHRNIQNALNEQREMDEAWARMSPASQIYARPWLYADLHYGDKIEQERYDLLARDVDSLLRAS